LGVKLLDLFCGAGGAAVGYARAGFEVCGVDIAPQPNYPFRFRQHDALAVPIEVLRRFDVIHASPPCQWATAYSRRPDHVGDAPNLIAATRDLLTNAGLPYVIENVEYARNHLRDPIMLCGSSFGLDVRRHRLFECSGFSVMALPCAHGWQSPRFAQATNRKNRRCTVEVGVWRIPLDVQQRAMGIDWMTLDELSEAIPPAYTEWVGRYAMAALTTGAQAA
jgi:DNA (cytosine-5)-methyltransferase 1